MLCLLFLNILMINGNNFSRYVSITNKADGSTFFYRILPFVIFFSTVYRCLNFSVNFFKLNVFLSSFQCIWKSCKISKMATRDHQIEHIRGGHENLQTILNLILVIQENLVTSARLLGSDK